MVSQKIAREAIKSHNRLNLGNHPNRGGVSGMMVVSQPLTFAIITREKNHHLKKFKDTSNFNFNFA